MNDKQGPSSWVTYYKICVADTWLCQVDKCQREMEKEKERNHLCLRHKSTSAPTNIRVGPQDENSSNLHITADSTGSIHKNARGKKFDPKKFV